MVLEVGLLEAVKICKIQNLRTIDKDQTVMAGCLGQGIFIKSCEERSV